MLTGRRQPPGPRLGRLGQDDDAVAGAREAQQLDRQLFDDVGVGGVEQAHLLLQAGTHSLETRYLRPQLPGAFDQSTARLEAALTNDGVIGEVAKRTQAEKRHQDLPRPAFAPIVHGKYWGCDARPRKRPTGTHAVSYAQAVKRA